MGLESATYISQLVATNPLSTDLESQGDDHLRLLKAVLQACFPNADKAFRFPSATAKSGNYTVVSTDDNVLFYVDTSGGAVTLTLPTLAAGDKGWRIRVLKTTTDANPIFIVPPSGTINSYTKVRRSVEFVPFEVVWTGTGFFATRQFGVPIGTVLEFASSSLPNGCLWPDGGSFSATNYVELNTVLGQANKPDQRGCVAVSIDNYGTGASGRIGSVILLPNNIWNVYGAEQITLGATQIPSHTHNYSGSGTTGGQSQGHTHSLPSGSFLGSGTGSGSATNSPSGGVTFHLDAATGQPSQDHNHGFSWSGTTDGGTGGGLAHSNLQPSIVMKFMLVAE